MLGALTLLLLYQLASEVIVQFFVLPIPGPVIGMALLFVPAGVGVMVHFARLGEEWPAIIGALVASTFVTLGVTGLLMCAFVRRGKSQP